MSPTLVVTNDFPPRPGGIQEYVYELARRLDSVVVLTSRWPGDDAFDARQPFPVVRADARVLLPTPATARLARRAIAEHGCDTVWFGAAAPLGLLAPRLPVLRRVASTQGHEVGWARLPAARTLLRRVARQVDALTHLSSFTGARLARRLGPYADRLVSLPPGVDTDRFRPGAGGARVRATYGLDRRPVIVCVSRLVPRKGQDVLIRALPQIRRAVPEVVLLLVGGGPHGRRLAEMARGLPVVFTGSVPASELPAYYDAGTVFAMPCRERLAGLDTEGLGMVFLEAAATALPVVAGTAGGSVDAVLAGHNGYLVDGRDPAAVAEPLVRLLTDPGQAAAMGAAGRRWVQREWDWAGRAHLLSRLLAP